MEKIAIVIPTLNRSNHLKQMMDSICKNSWADKVDVILSVDYPPDNTYLEGYTEVRKLIKNQKSKWKENVNNVIDIYQQKNLGMYLNSCFVTKYALDYTYDIFIFGEDDNILSPNAIEFIVKQLIRFKNDEDVVAVCAAGEERYVDSKTDVVKTSMFSGHVYGTWTTKWSKFASKINRNYFVETWKTSNHFRQLYKQDPFSLFVLKELLFEQKKNFILPDGEIAVIDCSIKGYLFNENKYVIKPTYSKVINIGYDGSGQNCKKIKGNEGHCDTSTNYDILQYQQVPISVIYEKLSVGVWVRLQVCLFKLWLYFNFLSKC